jgi:hypothetical protein
LFGLWFYNDAAPTALTGACNADTFAHDAKAGAEYQGSSLARSFQLTADYFPSPPMVINDGM